MLDNTEPSLNIDKDIQEGVETREGQRIKVYSPLRLAKKVLLGTMLGDAAIDKNQVTKTKARFIMQHSVNQLPYVIWKMQLLQPVLGMYGVNLYRVGAGNNKMYGTIRVRSQLCRFGKYIYDDFYFERNGKVQKEVHINILRRLTAESLAVWYTDDGSLECTNISKVPSMVSLAVCSFSEQEQELIKNYMFDVWGVDASWKESMNGKTEKRYKSLRMCGNNMRRFIDIVEPHICPWMKYKVDPSHKRETLSYDESDEIVRSLRQRGELIGLNPIVNSNEF